MFAIGRVVSRADIGAGRLIDLGALLSANVEPGHRPGDALLGVCVCSTPPGLDLGTGRPSRCCEKSATSVAGHGLASDDAPSGRCCWKYRDRRATAVMQFLVLRPTIESVSVRDHGISTQQAHAHVCGAHRNVHVCGAHRKQLRRHLTDKSTANERTT